jgi:hypothetical protein
MPDQVHMEGIHAVPIRSNSVLEHLVGSVRGGRLLNEAQPAADAMDMGIDRHRGEAEAEEHHAGRGLWSDARQRDKPTAECRKGQICQGIQGVASQFFVDRVKDALDPWSLDVGKSTGPNNVSQLSCRRSGNSLPIRIRGTQRGERSLCVPIRRMLGKDRADELVQWRSMRMPLRDAIECRQVGFKKGEALPRLDVRKISTLHAIPRNGRVRNPGQEILFRYMSSPLLSASQRGLGRGRKGSCRLWRHDASRHPRVLRSSPACSRRRT